MSAEIIYGTDFRKHLSKPQETSHNDAVLDRLHGVPANVPGVGVNEPGHPNVYTAPDGDCA